MNPKHTTTPLTNLIDRTNLGLDKCNFLKQFFSSSFELGTDILGDEIQPVKLINPEKTLKIFPSEYTPNLEGTPDPLNLTMEGRDFSFCVYSLFDEGYNSNKRASFSNSRNQPVSKSPLGKYSCVIDPCMGEDDISSFEAFE